MNDSVVMDAMQFARALHYGQKYGDRPYIGHCRDVVMVLIQYGDGGNVLAAAWLHDILEDCTLTTSDNFYFANHFPQEVQEIVRAVTCGPGKDRAEKWTETYPRIMACENRGFAAVKVKLADRIANVRECIKNSDKRLEMYRLEYPAFREALWIPLYYSCMWDELDRLMEV